MDLFSHVAVAIDFSEPSEVALRACFSMAREVGIKKVTVIHAIKPVVVPKIGTEAVQRRLTDLRERVRRQAQEQLTTWCNAWDRPASVELVMEVVEGRPTDVIPERAKAAGAKMLLVGTHARKGLSRLLHPSVAEKMLAGPLLPIAVLPTGEDGIEPEFELSRMNRVLVAVDLSQAAGRAVARVGFEAAAAFSDEPTPVTVLSVAELPSMGSVHGGDDVSAELIAAVKAHVEANLAELVAEYAGRVDVESRVELGRPGDVIHDVAEETGARLVVLGSHGHDIAPFLSIGSVTTEVVRRSNVSVLVVPSHIDE